MDLPELLVTLAAIVVLSYAFSRFSAAIERRRQSRKRAGTVADAAELGNQLMLEHGPVSQDQMHLVWHGIHQMIAVHGGMTAEQLRYLITEARKRKR